MNSFDLGELVLTVLFVSRTVNKFSLVICAAGVLNVWFISVLKWPCGIYNICHEVTVCLSWHDPAWFMFVLTWCDPVWFISVCLSWHDMTCVIYKCVFVLTWRDPVWFISVCPDMTWPCVIYVCPDMTWPSVIYKCLSWHDMTLCDL